MRASCTSLFCSAGTASYSGIPLAFYPTTFTSASTFPLADVVGGYYRFSGEFSPRAGTTGQFETDYALFANSALDSYGYAVVTLPTTDSDGNGVIDLLQPEISVNVNLTGSSYRQWPSQLTTSLIGSMSRSAGSLTGTYSITSTQPGSSITYRGTTMLGIATGSFVYDPATRFGTFVFAMTNLDGSVSTSSGTTAFNVVSTDRVDFPQCTLTRSDHSQTVAKAFTLLRTGNHYRGIVALLDGNTVTSWPDYINWVVDFIDLNDVDRNGIPDLSDVVILPPTITANPQSQTVNAGANISFSVSATGTIPFSYQWRKNATNIPGATSATLLLTNVQPSNAGSYSVVVSNAADIATSQIATLTVNVPVAPTIVTQPTNQSITVGGSASFSVLATGTPPLAYQWRFNGINIAGATNFAITITNAQTTNAGSYNVIVSNSQGGLPSSMAVLAVNVPVTAPSITTGPQSQSIILGQSVVFSVTASGTIPLMYQWQFNGVNLASPNGSSLTISNVQPTNGGQYSVRISNSAGSTTSPPATLTVIVPPTISLQPQSQAVNRSSTATFSVIANGTAPLSYQWQHNGTNLTSGTTDTLTLTNVQVNQAGKYRVIVFNTAGATTSSDADLLFNWILTATAGRGGNISTPSPSYAPNSLASLTATPQIGFVFKNWTGAASGTNNPLSVLMDGDKTIAANFVVRAPRLGIAKAANAGGIQLAFPTVPGERYRIDVSTDTINWTPLTIMQAINAELQYQVFIGQKQGFYRVAWEP